MKFTLFSASLGMIRKLLGTLLLLCAGIGILQGQTLTVGAVEVTPAVADGYLLVAPYWSTNNYLVDNCGRLVNEWNNSAFRPGVASYLLPDGSLLKAGFKNNPNFNFGGEGGIIERWSWGDSLLWSFEYSASTYVSHHDFEYLPNGNILILATEKKQGLELIAAGRNPALTLNNTVWSEFLVEVQPVGNDSGIIVWEWHAWDHLIQDYDSTAQNFGVVGQHPNRIDLNYIPRSLTEDWQHMNGVDYNPVLDQIILSVGEWSEMWIIDHGTTTAEAMTSSGGSRGLGGDILYRYGNPAAYDRGSVSDQYFDYLHDPHWIPDGLPYEGEIILYNNGNGRQYASVEVFNPPTTSPGDYIQPGPGVPFGPVNVTRTYAGDSTSRFWSRIMSGAQMQANGNILICNSVNGNGFEVDDQDNIVYRYVQPIGQAGPYAQGDTVPILDNAMFRLERYAPNFPGLVGRSLIPGALLELNGTSGNCVTILSSEEPIPAEEFAIYPNPFDNYLNVVPAQAEDFDYQIYDAFGRLYDSGTASEGVRIETSNMSRGMYFLIVKGQPARKLVKN